MKSSNRYLNTDESDVELRKLFTKAYEVITNIDQYHGTQKKIEAYSYSINIYEFLCHAHPTFHHTAVKVQLAQALYARSSYLQEADDLLAALADYQRVKELFPGEKQVEDMMSNCVRKLREVGVKALFDDKIEDKSKYIQPKARKAVEGVRTDRVHEKKDEFKVSSSSAFEPVEAKSDDSSVVSVTYSRFGFMMPHLGYGSPEAPRTPKINPFKDPFKKTSNTSRSGNKKYK